MFRNDTKRCTARKGLIPRRISDKKNDVPSFLTTQCVSDIALRYTICTNRKFRKLECAKRDEIPTRSEIQRCLGTSLAQVLFDYSHREAVKLLDSISAKLSQQSCCVTRDDQLKADAMEMWPKRQEILKSYLHSDILALGEGELKKFQAEIETTTQKRLRDEFVEERRMLEAEKRFAIRCNADKIHATYEEYFKSAQQELKEKLQVELLDADEKRNTELQKAIVKARIDTTHDVLRKIRPQMDWVVTSLYNEFEQTRRAQREQMIADFNNIIRKEHLKLDARIKEIEMKKMEELRIQCHEFEIRNFMNVIYIFYMERLRSSSQLQVIYKHFEMIRQMFKEEVETHILPSKHKVTCNIHEKIKSLHEFIAGQEETMNTMREKNTKYRNKNKMLQEKINALTKEFQKFINFAFKTLPEHADFLLPLNLQYINNTNKEDNKREKSDK